MNQLFQKSTVIAIVVAIALWALATWLDQGREPPGPPRGVASPTLMEPVARDTPVRTDVTARDCREAEESMRDSVQASRGCAVDEDCTIFDYGYPIDCMTSVARDRITALRLAYREYEQACPYRVYFDCPSEPMERVPVCRNNRCAVELRTIEMLRDETLEHIGVGPEHPGQREGTEG